MRVYLVHSSPLDGNNNLEYFLQNFFNFHLLAMNGGFSRKNIVITGANTGIGLSTAKSLCGRDTRVILACRSLKLGQEACDVIRSSVGDPDILLDVMVLDLADLDSIRFFAKEYISKYSKLSVLVNNAGVAVSTYKTTEQGVEMTMGVNYLGHFYLTNLLLPALMEAQPSRIIFVTSSLHSYFKYDFDGAFNSKSCGGLFWSIRQYSYSKSANLLNMVGLVKLFRRNEIRSSQISVNCVHPGSVATRLNRNYNKFVVKVSNFFVRMFGVTPDVGCKPIVKIATSGSLNGISGKYYSKMGLDKAESWAISEENADELWDCATRFITDHFGSVEDAYPNSPFATWLTTPIDFSGTRRNISIVPNDRTPKECGSNT